MFSTGVVQSLKSDFRCENAGALVLPLHAGTCLFVYWLIRFWICFCWDLTNLDYFLDFHSIRFEWLTWHFSGSCHTDRLPAFSIPFHILRDIWYSESPLSLSFRGVNPRYGWVAFPSVDCGFDTVLANIGKPISCCVGPIGFWSCRRVIICRFCSLVFLCCFWLTLIKWLLSRWLCNFLLLNLDL